MALIQAVLIQLRSSRLTGYIPISPTLRNRPVLAYLSLLVSYAIGESGESCIMSKWYQGDLFEKYTTDEKNIYIKELSCRFLPILVLLATEVEESRDNL